MNISEVLPNGNVRVVVPIKFRCVKQTKVIVFPENEIGIQMQLRFSLQLPMRLHGSRCWMME